MPCLVQGRALGIGTGKTFRKEHWQDWPVPWFFFFFLHNNPVTLGSVRKTKHCRLPLKCCNTGFVLTGYSWATAPAWQSVPPRPHLLCGAPGLRVTRRREVWRTVPRFPLQILWSHKPWKRLRNSSVSAHSYRLTHIRQKWSRVPPRPRKGNRGTLGLNTYVGDEGVARAGGTVQLRRDGAPTAISVHNRGPGT